MTQFKEIQDLLCFKGIINKYHIKLYSKEKYVNDEGLKVIISIVK